MNWNAAPRADEPGPVFGWGVASPVGRVQPRPGQNPQPPRGKGEAGRGKELAPLCAWVCLQVWDPETFWFAFE